MTAVEQLARMAYNLGVGPIYRIVLEDPRFKDWTGGSQPHQHHYGRGGLAQHVLEVCQIAQMNNQYFTALGKGVDDKKLFLACLFHDAGKMWDYRPLNAEFSEWDRTEHCHQIYHISRSALLWYEHAKSFNWKEEDVDEVLHAILSHHGQKDWGSPVTPKTRLAWILHLSDCMSARVDDCLNPKPK